jgi:hypothetical protein
MIVRLVTASVRTALAAALVAASASSSLAAGIQVLDGGVIDGSPARRASAMAAAKAATPLQLVPLTQKLNLGGTTYNYSGPLSFDWTSDTVSVLVYMESSPANGPILAAVDQRRPEDPIRDGGPSTAFVLPGADVPVANGTYQFEIASSSENAEVILVRRRGAQPTSGTVDVNFFDLQGSGLDQGILQQAVGLFADVFAKAGIRMGRLTLITVTGADDLLSVPGDSGVGSPLRQVPTLSNLADNPAALNLFFVREITSSDGMLFGISMGIPAALTIPGTISSGVIVNVSAHQTAGGFDTRNFGQTMVHETGHSLGLRHSTEADGSGHDLISDTPECQGGYPLMPESCPDGLNFMFWSGLDFGITPGQAYVMLRSPVVH